jgi:hypothetical protein
MCVVASPLADPLLRDDGALRIEFSVFPNPTNGVFYLKIEDASQISYQVKVMDLIGKPIIQREITSTEDVRFDLSTSPKGIYFIQITRGQDQIIQRVVIQ